MEKQFVIVTGDSEGLGNAALHWLLRVSEDCRVIGVSRRPVEGVEGVAEMPAQQKDRYTHLQADFSQDLSPLLSQIRELIVQENGELSALLLVNGTGYLDSMVEENPHLQEVMERLNYEAPIALVDGLRANGVLTSKSRVFYYSGLVTHPSITDPLLRRHAEIKKRSVKDLGVIVGERFTKVMPGAYRTDMLLRTIKRTDSLLEWFAMPLADPYAPGGISNVVADAALRPNGDQPESIIRPRCSKLLVSVYSKDGLREALPGAIRRAARTVLTQVEQSIDEHDARVQHAKDNQTYGSDFDYDAIRSENLWSERRSKAYSKTMELMQLLR